ncbi:hypothetical protein J2I47_24295 [Fibrella sp. HMF5335]|uniref:Uncharacterized protein n=1 Tax=Fibrella rubiginis TaxID=2817060 RepID=A0A939GMS7_9BACT|nr:hypothetical protein [Fibrella rubiginis]MBO0939690.1 hypothetical protein [Fibrella rubiginis]
MNWTPTHFPAAMRSLSPSTRAKAIEIANTLLLGGESDRQQVIEQSIAEARVWARTTQREPVARPAFVFPQH